MSVATANCAPLLKYATEVTKDGAAVANPAWLTIDSTSLKLQIESTDENVEGYYTVTLKASTEPASEEGQMSF